MAIVSLIRPLSLVASRFAIPRVFPFHFRVVFQQQNFPSNFLLTSYYNHFEIADSGIFDIHGPHHHLHFLSTEMSVY